MNTWVALTLLMPLGALACRARPVSHDAGAPADAGSADLAIAVPQCAAASATPVRIAGHIAIDTTLTCDQQYLFSETVVVDEPATLTIAQGTTVVMASGGSLIVAPGAKLMAMGTRDQPIVFTSAHVAGTRSPGDWGAIVLVGRAPGNWGLDNNGMAITKQAPDANDWPSGFPYAAGGGDWSDSSGTLAYVRLEYGGMPRDQQGATDHEMLGLYGVGSGTTLDYIDMRHGNYGCLFAEGGAFDARHLVCQWGGNTAFGFSRGNKSRVQFLLDQENPMRGAEGVGIKGPYDANTLAPLTDPTIYNVTVCGINGSPATIKDAYALFMKRKPAGRVYNFIGMGFHAGLAMIATQAGMATTQLHSALLFMNFDVNVKDTNIAYPTGTDPYAPSGNDVDMTAWFDNPAWMNTTADPGITGCFDATTLAAAPATAITTDAATPPDDGFFDPAATYLGAFRDAADAWASGAWIVWSAN